MAVVLNVNKRRGCSRLSGRHIWNGVCVVFCYGLVFDLAAGTATAANESPVISYGTDSTPCTRNLSIEAGAAEPLSPELLELQGRTNITFDVRACGEAHVYLYALLDLGSRPPRPDVIDIVIGSPSKTEPATVIKAGLVCSDKVNQTQPSPSRCGEFRRFVVSWEMGIEAQSVVDGTWRPFLTCEAAPWGSFQIYSIFVAYIAEDNSTSEWKIDVPCAEPDDSDTEGDCAVDHFDYSSMVTRGHLAGAVITALLAGILFGAFCVRFGPKVILYIRGKIQSPKQSKGETSPESEELTSLVGVGTSPAASDKPPDTVRSSIEAPAPDLQLPGDSHPSPRNHPPGRAFNSYTPYNLVGGAAATATSASGSTAAQDDGARKAADVTKSSDPRKISTAAGRATSPLPELPTEAGGGSAVTSEPPEEMYVNADAHIYEGVRHEAPIYENRNVGVYESLGASKETGK